MKLLKKSGYLKGEIRMNRLLLNVPAEFKTERLYLRVPAYSGDGTVVNQAVKESIEELRVWLPWAREEATIEETEMNLRNAHIKFLERESFRFLIFHRETKEYIGTCSLQNIDWDVPKCEIGYWIQTKAAGNGYMTEAIKALITFGVENFLFRKIVIICESTNLKSRAIPERLGFKLEGTLKNDDLSADGSRLTDTCIYGFLP